MNIRCDQNIWAIQLQVQHIDTDNQHIINGQIKAQSR